MWRLAVDARRSARSSRDFLTRLPSNKDSNASDDDYYADDYGDYPSKIDLINPTGKALDIFQPELENYPNANDYYYNCPEPSTVNPLLFFTS